uniref:Uncharacterized protein n=1 Tax=Chlamydomonas euryale TaxID=1486919 RepID=A0A7R9YXQ7_9CHLO
MSAHDAVTVKMQPATKNAIADIPDAGCDRLGSEALTARLVRHSSVPTIALNTRHAHDATPARCATDASPGLASCWPSMAVGVGYTVVLQRAPTHARSHSRRLPACHCTTESAAAERCSWSRLAAGARVAAGLCVALNPAHSHVLPLAVACS